MRTRHAGVLLHPSSLPGPGPVGELGPYADAFLEWMSQAGLDRWQVLPLHPVGPGWSPYASPSAFAGDSRLISVEVLVAEGILDPVSMPWGHDAVDHALVEQWKMPLLRGAAARVSDAPQCRSWVEAQGAWLADWAVYAAMAGKVGDGWTAFPAEAQAPSRALRRELDAEARVEEGLQYLFARQWDRLRAQARARGIRIIGDLPLYVSGDGCDVWTHRRLFRFGGGVPDPVAGVPPDYFSPEGQRWGNPTYAWEVHAADGYAWWVRRLRRELELVDLVRLDHFRGLVACWVIPAAEADARLGAWEPGPGRPLFDALREALGSLPLLAEDLGEITPEVIELREALGLPGMKVLQFAFGGGAEHPFLPHNFDGSNWVVYTGTHDNDTVMGWFRSADEATRHRVRRYGARDDEDLPWALLREAWASVAATAVAPMQDVIGVGTEARMNTPGRAEGNWSWRLRDFPWDRCAMMRGLAEVYGRAGLSTD